jgi:6-phosphogluconolactonase
MTSTFSIAYVSCSRGNCIDVLVLDLGTGTLGRAQRVALSGNGMPLASAPDGGHLYAAVFGGSGEAPEPRYEVFRVAGTGSLSRVGQVNAPGRMSFIAVDRAGRFLLGASVAGNLITTHAIGADGMLAPEPVLVSSVPSGAHQITTDLTNSFAFIPNLGAALVQQMLFDAETGRLAPNSSSELRLPDEAGPRHVAHHPNGRFIYLLTEVEGALRVCSLDRARGTLDPVQVASIVPDDFDGQPWGAQIHVDASGRFVITSERNTSTVRLHAIDPQSGQVQSYPSQPVESCPRGFDIDPSGRWLVVAGEKSDQVSSYEIDPGHGTLTWRSTVQTGEGPIWVEIPKPAV